MDQNPIPNHKLATLAASVDRESYGKEMDFVLHVNHHFPDSWEHTTPRARNVLAVISQYLDADAETAEQRFAIAIERAAVVRGRTERTLRDSCGRLLYDIPVPSYMDRFLCDLQRLERDWRAFQSGERTPG